MSNLSLHLMAFYSLSPFSSYRLFIVVCVVNCKSLQVATYRHVSTLKRIWTMKNDFSTYTMPMVEKRTWEMKKNKRKRKKHERRPSIKLNVVKIKAHNRKTIFLLSFRISQSLFNFSSSSDYYAAATAFYVFLFYIRQISQE